MATGASVPAGRHLVSVRRPIPGSVDPCRAGAGEGEALSSLPVGDEDGRPQRRGVDEVRRHEHVVDVDDVAVQPGGTELGLGEAVARTIEEDGMHPLSVPHTHRAGGPKTPALWTVDRARDQPSSARSQARRADSASSAAATALASPAASAAARSDSSFSIASTS